MGVGFYMFNIGKGQGKTLFSLDVCKTQVWYIAQYKKENEKPFLINLFSEKKNIVCIVNELDSEPLFTLRQACASNQCQNR